MNGLDCRPGAGYDCAIATPARVPATRTWLKNTEVRVDGTRPEAHGVLTTVGFFVFRIENA